MPARINGFSLAYTAFGGVILWSGIKGTTLTSTFRGLLQGQAPSTDQEQIGTAPAAIGSTTSAASTSASNTASLGVGATGPAPGAVTSIDNYNLARMVASTYGWGTGTQWADLTQVINRESGGNQNAMNPSGAYGIAQALGHATSADAGSVSRTAYGGYGVPTATNVGANSGNATDQLVWMMAYIKEAYGEPSGAWNSEQTRGFY